MNYVPRTHSFRPANPQRPSIRCPDLLGMVGYHDKATVLSSFVSAHDATFVKFVADLPNMAVGSGTNFNEALRVANNLLLQTPKGLRKRIWMLSDGMDNIQTEDVFKEVRRAQQHRININTVGFCLAGSFEGARGTRRLEAIAAATKTGRFTPADTIVQLGRALKRTASTGANTPHQGEATVFCIDLSPSMKETIEGQTTKIEAVRDAMFDLVRYKQRMWS